MQLTQAAQTAFDDHVNALTQHWLEQARVLVKPEETNRLVLETLQELATLEQTMSK